jgi:hypothetical protein
MKVPGFFAFAFLALGAPNSSFARPHPSPIQQASGVCGINDYRNVSGNCVHRPILSGTVPQGATAQCRDGTYSFSQHHRGTCSYHGDVARWL